LTISHRSKLERKFVIFFLLLIIAAYAFIHYCYLWNTYVAQEGCYHIRISTHGKQSLITNI